MKKLQRKAREGKLTLRSNDGVVSLAYRQVMRDRNLAILANKKRGTNHG